MDTEENRYNIRNLDRSIRYIGVTRFIRAMGRSSTFIFLPLVLIQTYSLSFLETGLIQGTATLIMAFVQLYSGRLSDRIGRRLLMVYSPIPNIFLFLLIFFSIYSHLGILILVGSWYATVVVTAMQFPALQAAVADLSKPEDRMSAFTLVRIMVNIGTAIGPLLGGVLATFGFEYIFLVASIATVFEVSLMYLTVPESYYVPRKADMIRTPRIRYRNVLSNRFFLVFIVVSIIFQFFIRQSSVSLTVYAVVLNNLSLIKLGLVYAVNGSMVVLLQFRMLRMMTSRWSAIIWRSIGTLVWAGSFFILAFSASFAAIIFFMIISTLGENFTTPTTNTIVTKIAPPSQRGTYVGAFGFFSRFGSFLGSALGLFMLSMFQNVTSGFWIIVVVGTILVAVAYRKLDHGYNREIAYQAGIIAGKESIADES